MCHCPDCNTKINSRLQRFGGDSDYNEKGEIVFICPKCSREFTKEESL